MASNVKDYLLPSSGPIPNNPRLPLLVYPQAFPGCTSTEIRNHFHAHNWGKSWVNGVFSYHHFHSNSHEVLGCFAGSATVQFGGEDGPRIDMKAGDAVLIPAGVGHKNLRSTPDFGVVGAYPPGTTHDLCVGQGDPDKARASIAAVPIPDTDPVLGTSGGILTHWPLPDQP